MQDWEKFGEEIKRTVQDAVDSQDYQKLNQMITDTLNRAVNSIPPIGSYRWNGQKGKNWSQGMQDYKTQEQPPRQYGYSNAQKTLVLYGSTAGARVSGIVMSIVGGSMSLIFFITMMAVFFVSMPENQGIVWMLRIVLTLLTVGNIWLTSAGVKILKQAGRFKNYIRRIAGREYCNISELSSGSGNSVQFVIKDLKKMISRGWFRQGHLDAEKKCLILSNRVYEEYLQIEKSRKQAEIEKRDAENKKQAFEKEKIKNEKLTPEVQKILEQGDAFIKKIHACNDAIPGEEISAKISRMEMLVDRIFDRVEENPQSVSDIRKLMEYYLPTTVKLLEAYEQMDRQPVGGTNIQTAKREIEATLDTLNTAFEKLLDDLFQDTMWDVASDITVLNTMLAQEGLKEDGLKK